MANAVVRRCLISVSLAWAFGVQAAGGSFVVPGSKAASETSCVEPTEYMRRNHMEVIEHQRDETVHGGIRGTKHSLAGCIACHVGYDSSGAPVPVNEPDQFCNTCHRYMAVSPNCFDCHATVPTPAASVGDSQGAEQ